MVRGMAIEWTPIRVNIILSAFGGIRPMATILGHKNVTTIRSWREAKRIPIWREDQIIAAAQREGIRLPKWFTNGRPA